MALEGDLSCIRWDCWGRVLLGMALSALAGFWAGRWALQGVDSVKLSRHTALLAQMPGTACVAFLHGAQDGQKFLGIFLLGLSLARGEEGGALPSIPL